MIICWHVGISENVKGVLVSVKKKQFPLFNPTSVYVGNQYISDSLLLYFNCISAVSLLSCGCLCSVSLPRGSMGWSAVSDRGISWVCSFFVLFDDMKAMFFKLDDIFHHSMRIIHQSSACLARPSPKHMSSTCTVLNFLAKSFVGLDK